MKQKLLTRYRYQKMTLIFEINMLIIGVDEAGRGPVIGPLVVCSVAIPDEDIALLLDAGVKDSKDLSKKKRAVLRDWFLENCQERGWKYSLITCSTSRIDSAVYDKGLNILETELFAEALNGLGIDHLASVKIINDACDVNEERFTKRVSALVKSWPWENSVMNSYHKADENYPIVGMASIMAKQHRDYCVKEIEASFGSPIGSGYPSDPKTVDAVRRMISDKPHEDLRWSWSTVSRIWGELHSTDMPKRVVLDKNQTTLF